MDIHLQQKSGLLESSKGDITNPTKSVDIGISQKITAHFIRTETISDNVSNRKENLTQSNLVTKTNICIYRLSNTLIGFQQI